MNPIHINNIKAIKETNQKDMEKGQKILAAIYMVTNHVPETDPIRQSLRQTVSLFVCAASIDAKSLLRKIEILMGAAVFAGLVGEKNSSIILYEMKRWCESISFGEGGGTVESFLQDTDSHKGHNQSFIKDTKKDITRSTSNVLKSSISTMSYRGSNAQSFVDKNARQNTILSFINDRKSAVIKDIVSLFPDVSEKTIQRELNKLVENGKITKRGSKRWSVYMAVNSLL